MGRWEWSARFLAGALCVLLVAAALWLALAAPTGTQAAVAVFCTAWVVTAAIPYALYPLGFVPAAVTLVTVPIALAPPPSTQALVAAAVIAQWVEIAVLGWAPGHTGMALRIRLWLPVAGWAMFIAALAVVLTAGLGRSLSFPLGSAVLLGAAVTWSLVWLVPAARIVRVSWEMVVKRPPEDVYRALAELSDLVLRDARVLSCEALGGGQWRMVVKRPGGGVVEQTVRLLEAHAPERLTFATDLGSQRGLSTYRIQDDGGDARIGATTERVVPYAIAVLGARWAVRREQEAQLTARLAAFGKRLESSVDQERGAPANT